MKREFSKYTRKTLSVFMAVLMVLSMFVFVPEMFTKAEAATAGTYYYKVTFVVTDDMDNVKLKSTLYGKNNNGTGSEVTIASKNYTTNTDFSGTMTIMEGTTSAGVFPTRFRLYNEGTTYYAGRNLKGYWHLYVGADANNLTEVYLNGTLNSSNVEKMEVGSGKGAYWYWEVRNAWIGGKNNTFDVYYNVANDYLPSQNTITGLSATTMLIDKTTGSKTSAVMTGVVKDQYGVNWYQAPTYSLTNSSVTSFSDPSIATSGDGVKLTATTACLTTANGYSTSTGQAKFTLKATSGTASQSVTITVESPTYYVYFYDGNGDLIGTKKSCYYNGSVTAPTTADKDPDETYHYTFNGTWDKAYTPVKSDITTTAQFDAVAHTLSYTQVDATNHHEKCSGCIYEADKAHNFSSVITSPTCTASGYITYTCAKCNYSYQGNYSDALGHNYEFKGFTWNGYSSATATFVCSNDNTHTQTVTAKITSVTDKEANCVETGSRTYTATAEFNSVTYTDTKTEKIAIDATNHKTLVTDPKVPATTDKVGLTDGKHCSACGTVTKAQKITPTVAKTKVYEGAITNNIKGSYTYLGVTAEKPTDMVSQTQPNCETTVTGTYGTINIENGEAVYTVTTMQFSGTETFYLLTKVENINSNNGALSAYVFEKVTIVPAKTLYYEDNFSSADGITYTDGVCSDGSSKYGKWKRNGASSVNDAADEAADLVYNSDDKNYAMLSGSSAHTVSVSELNKGNSNKNWPSATFTFAGTGFDVISLTDSDSGVFYVTVYNTEGKLVKTVLMDTYYGYTYCPLYFSTVTRKIVGSPEDGVTVPLYPSIITDKNNIPENDKDYIVTSNGAIYTTNTAKASSPKQAYGWVKTGNAQTLYQVPVIHIDGLAYGTYTAKIEARFTGLFGHYNTDEAGVKYYDLCIDAIRINNPFNTASPDEAYEQSGQSRVNYTDIKSSLSGAEAASGANATGLILLDGGKTVSQGRLEDYKEVLPKNEIYLSGGQSVAFDIDTADYEDVLIGMRSANAAPLTVQVIYGSKKPADIAINSGTELYYSILTALGKDSLSGTVVIKNKTDGAILSMTKMKTVAKENAVSAAAMPMTLSMFTAPRAMALLAMTESDLSIDEESVETATEEGKITLSVTTGADVSSLIIRDENGNELTPDEVNSVVSGDEIRWTVTLTETESGRYTYSLEGAYENGYTNGDTVEITVDVEITEPVPEEPEIPSDETEDSGKTDSFVELFDFLVSLLKMLLSRIFGVELV